MNEVIQMSFGVTFYDSSLKHHYAKIDRSFNGSYFVYVDDKFFCSADSIWEAENEVAEYIKENNYKTSLEVM